MTYCDTFTAERPAGAAYRALLIDPWARTIVEGWQQPKLAALYATLSGPGFPKEEDFPTDPAQWEGLERDHVAVSTIDIRGIGNDRYGKPVDLICDDEGRLRAFQACFRLGGPDGMLIAGRAMIASHDEEGETVSTSLELHDARRPLEWLPWNTNYDPPPMRFFASEPGESFEELQARAAREMGGGQ